MQNSIHPGQIWRDTNGKPIEAHAGAIFYEKEVFYWYGENKENTDGRNGIWTSGIRYYSSADLYNWKDEGYLIPPDPNNESSLLHPKYRMDRPHIVKSKGTGKYVCWLKFSGYEACFAVMQADQFSGPYEMIEEHYRPLGKKIGDFDITYDDTGAHWLIFEGDHKGIYCARLNKDCLAVSDDYVSLRNGLHAPFCREAPAHFRHNGLHYLITSGMTGYRPNPSEAMTANNIQGPYTIQGSPHVEDGSRASFNSQISFVFRHPHKKDLYIAMADRWMPDYMIDSEKSEAIERYIASHYSDKYVTKEEDKEIFMSFPANDKVNTSRSTYVWLPLRFNGNDVYIDWLDNWRIEDYE